MRQAWQSVGGVFFLWNLKGIFVLVFGGPAAAGGGG
jgi:hypothetical protein